MSNEPKLELIIVVNGQPVTVEGNLHAPIRTVINIALEKSGNTGQPAENWQLRDAGGQIFDPAQKLEDFHFPAGTTLFLNLMAGIGG